MHRTFSMTTHKWGRIKVMDSGKVVNGSEVTTVIRQVLEKAAAHKLEPNFMGIKY